jgi:hypothetical protein
MHKEKGWTPTQLNYTANCFGLMMISVSDLDPDLEYGSGSRRAKITQKIEKTIRNVMF